MKKNKAKEKVICFFNTAKVWGGGEKWHFEHALALKERGYSPIAVTAKNSDLAYRFKQANIPVYELEIGILSFLNIFKQKKIAEIFKQNSVSTVIINLSADLKIAAIVAKRVGVPRIIYRRGSAIPIKSNPLNKFLLQKTVTHILANSEETKRTVLEYIKLKPDKIRVIYNGIKLENYTFNVEQIKPFTIGVLGRLNKQKALHYFIDLVGDLRVTGLNFKALIGGKGELEEQLKAYTQEQKLDNYIEFAGFQTDINAFMQRIDVFVLTSKWEGFGYVLAEAAACGKPAIAFDISSNPELIVDGETGFLVKPFDINSLARKVLLLAQNSSMREQYGKNAYHRVQKKFSFKNSVSKFEDYLES